VWIKIIDKVFDIRLEPKYTSIPARKNIVTHFVIFLNAITNYKLPIEE
jgi:hypothetical protein